MPSVLNMPKFWMWQGSQYTSITQHSEYARICIDRVLNISWVLNMSGFLTWQGAFWTCKSNSFKHATVWVKVSEEEVNMPEYVWIYDHRQASEYVSYNTWREVTLQVNEYLLRDGCIQNPFGHIQNPLNYIR